jgi:SAM-dependent methyltransferase
MDDKNRSWIEGMAEAYDTGLVPTVFAPFAEDLADRVAARAPQRVLELGAGSGALTRVRLDRTTAAVTATDLNDAMVAVGRANAPGAHWQQADAMALPFDAKSFDVVTAQFCAMFFPDKPAAFAQVRHCLTPGGAFLFNTWGPIAEHAFEVAVMEGLEAFFGAADAPRFLEQIPHGYHDVATVEADLRAGGFELRDAQRFELVGRAPSAAVLAEGYCRGTPNRNAIAEREANVDDVIAAVRAALEARFGTGPIEGRMSALVFDAA